MNETEISALIEELSQAAQVYYQELGDSLMTDEEFDTKLSFLASMEDSFPHLFIEGSPGFKLLENEPSLGSAPTGDDVIPHAIPMLSLKKAKTEAELTAWLAKMNKQGAIDFQLQAKLDGFALCARYEQGALVLLATRGDGVVGEDTSYLVNDPQVTVVGLPTTLQTTDTLEVRGELFFTDDQFLTVDNTRMTLTGERFKNSRNAVVGLMKKAKKGVDYPVEFTFATYSIYREGKLVDLTTELTDDFSSVVAVTQAQVPSLKLSGFASQKEVYQAVAKFGEARKGFTIPTDGVVIKPINEGAMQALMGNTSHHPASQIAFKYPAETAVTTLTSIDYTVGKTGKITPVGRVVPTNLSGIEISNISLHNFNWIYEKNVRVGSTVEITRANDVIPQISTVLIVAPDSELIEVPTECPICMSELQSVRDENIWPPRTLRCDNLACPSRDFFALKAAVGKNYLDIDGMSEVTLTYLNDIGRVNTIDELFTLTVEELAVSQLGVSQQGNPRRLGEKRAKHIVEHIEKAKTTPLPKLLATLNITGLGNRTAKDIVAHFQTLDAILEATYEDFFNLPNMGAVRARTLVEGFAHRRELIERMKSNGVVFASAETSDDASLAGLSFAISGTVPEPFANRGAWVDFIEAQGAKFDSAPKATTSFMIGDPEDTSSKIKKANSLGIEIISPAEFTARYTS